MQKNIRKLQLLSLGAAVCGGQIDQRFNGSTQIHDPLGIIVWEVVDVTLQAFNAYALQDCSNKLPESIKTFSRLCIGWGLWRIEKKFLLRCIFSKPER